MCMTMGFGFGVFHQEYRLTFTESSFGTRTKRSGMINAVPAHLMRLQKNRTPLLLLALGPLRPVVEHDR